MEIETPLINVKPNVDPNTLPSDEYLKKFVDRIERLEEEKKELCDDIREVYQEARGLGFDVKVLRQIIRLRKMDQADRSETEFLRNEYKKMLGIDE